jgi:hypothetical protein
MQAHLNQSEVDALIDKELAVRYSMYAEGTQASRVSAKKKVTEFNQLICGLPKSGGTEFPLFSPLQTASGRLLSAAQCARCFFTKWSHLKQSSLRALRSQITSVYAQMDAGFVPWDTKSGDREAPATKLVVDRIIALAEPPQSHEPLDHEVFRRAVEVLIRSEAKYKHSVQLCRASLAMAACMCIMRGSGGRPQEARLLFKSYLRPNYVAPGVRNGFNIFFPPKDNKGNKVSLKGKSDVRSRFKVIPERLEDGLHISNIIADFLSIAPNDHEGPLFQKVTNWGWSGNGWTPGDITSKLRDVLRDPRMELDWPEETVRMFSAHSLRATAATSMAAGGAQLPLVSTALNHKSTGVTLNHYVQFSKECIRKGLALTGPRGFVRHAGRGDHA